MNYSNRSAMYPYYQLSIVIYTVFKNLGIESYRKKSAVGLKYGKTKKAEPFLSLPLLFDN